MNKYHIEQVLPHRQPMILIDQLHQYDDQSGVCSVVITRSSLFFDNNQQAVPSYIGVEYMAQAIAAFAGADALDAGLPVEIGYLLGTRKYQPNTSWFNCGDELMIHVHRLYEEESGLRVFQCQIKRDDEVLVAAKINVFLPNKESNKESNKDNQSGTPHE